jgi:3-dehydroquinate dehydratase
MAETKLSLAEVVSHPIVTLIGRALMFLILPGVFYGITQLDAIKTQTTEIKLQVAVLQSKVEYGVIEQIKSLGSRVTRLEGQADRTGWK